MGAPGLPLFLQCTPHRLAKAAHSGHLSPLVRGVWGSGAPLGKVPPAFRSAGQEGGLGWRSGLGAPRAEGLVSPEGKATFGF